MRRCKRRISRRLTAACVGSLVLGIVAGLVVAGVSPLRAEPERLALAVADPRVQLERDDELVSIVPAGGEDEIGLVFYPGARVEPAAYAWKLAGLAAEGIAVFVPSMPLGYAFLGAGRADGIRADHPSIRTWLLGGHSLGGAMACRHARERPGIYGGLVLLASWCDRDIAGSGLGVVSLVGSEDGVATPAEVASRANLLPADATSLIVPGANHASWGDYGAQLGDGVATASDETVRDELTRRVLTIAP